MHIDNLAEWAARHGVSQQALRELLMLAAPAPAYNGLSGELAVQQYIRAEAPAHGCYLFRNNSGAAVDESGRPIRYGLGNDSPKINAVLKSSDLIGITPITVTAAHVGRRLGIFTAVEVKKPGWKQPSNQREQAQARFLTLVNAAGGIGTFASDVSHYREAIKRCIR